MRLQPVSIYCCGEIIPCERPINVCEVCGAKYNMEGDRISSPYWKEDVFCSRREEPDLIITVRE